MQLSEIFALLVGVLWGIAASPNIGRLCNTVSAVSMLATETALKAIILTSPAIAAAHKEDPAANSSPVILSPLPAQAGLHSHFVESVLGSSAAPGASRQLQGSNFESTIKASGSGILSEAQHTVNYPVPDFKFGSERRPCPQLESTSEAQVTTESRPVGFEIQSKPASHPSSEQKVGSAITWWPAVVDSLPLALRSITNSLLINLKPRALDADPIVKKLNTTPTDSLASTTTDKGPYFFSVNNGTTVWFDGRTPPPSISVVHHTSTIVVVPVANVPPKSSIYSTHSLVTAPMPFNASTTSKYEHNSTTFITSVMTQYLTITLTAASNPGASSTFAPHWINTTGRAGSSPLSLTEATGASSGFAYPTVIGTSITSSPTNPMHLNVARQVGVVVVATINSATVSWTNDYDGSELSTQSYPFVPPTTTLITMAKTTTVAPSSTPDTSEMPGSISSVSVVPVTPPSGPTSTPYSIATLTPLTTSSSVAASSTTFVSTTCTETTFSKATVSTLVTTTTSIAATTSPSATCSIAVRNPNNKGNFVVNFDDLPKYGASSNDTQYPPIFSPYHHLNWVTGFAYVPPPTDPYAPISKPQLAAFLENPLDNVHSNNGTDAGSFGVGDDLAQSALYFNAYSVYIGCTNKGPSRCEITFHGYIYEPAFQNQALDALQVVYQPPCPTLMNCGMLFIPFNDEFKNLTTMQITATVDGSPVDWYMDNLELGWANNSCEALKYRQNAE